MKLYECSSLKQAMKDPASVVSLTLPIGGPLPTGADYLQMPLLEMLYFTGTRPHQLPDEVRRLERLQRINFGGCERFPTWLDELPALRFVVGSFSRKPPPRTFKLPKLEHLGVDWKPGRFTTINSGRVAARVESTTKIAIMIATLTISDRSPLILIVDEAVGLIRRLHRF